MKRLRGEKGSALVMVMFMMLILTLLGVAVLSAAVGGARRTLTRENDIQSLQLTQKTLDESVAYIAANLEGQQVKADRLKTTLDSVVAGIPAKQPDSDGGVKTDLALASGRLVDASVSADFKATDPIKGNSSYTVTLVAEADVNGVKRTMQQKVRVSLYPDFLNYAFGSEEDLILNGSPYIKGNIYAGRSLRVSNMANYAYNGNSGLRQASLFPKMAEREDKSPPLAFVQSLDQFILSENNYPARSVNRGAAGEALSGELIKANVLKGLGIDLSQVRIRKNEQFIQINVDRSFREKLAGALKVDESALPQAAGLNDYLNGYDGALKMPEKPVEPVQPEPPSSDATQEELDQYDKEYGQYKKDLAQYEQDYLDYQAALTKLSDTLSAMNGTVVFNGNLNVDGKWLRDLIQTGKSTKAGGYDTAWLVVNGDLTVANTVDDSELRLYSNILVTGSVNLASRINVDSTLFALGGTTIQDATITGAADGGGSDKEIVLISKGSILLNRVDAFKPNNEARTLRGFFYTDATAELYGVGSNFDLRGGFFAKGNLTVNAVVGDSVEAPSRQHIVFDDQTGTKTSRFKVNYNDEVFEHQGLALPRVDRVSVKAEKIELAPASAD
ncbi:hypothetical protein [Saccharibacillus alkalitolerans]|uniref:Type 4 fimbrial biogenesis protein PilX N-terminal domain-containing protein n=1 Tax=Saccharibacillus alkalitolerans TaxID=2705290 RepID=A0ABX0F574_9BACL|nr:hypothetical protein [Saccharibacillus alkalitolerans]NGZ76087.1 hypothetical protein [Saccharibacillus alkalitolerans]